MQSSDKNIINRVIAESASKEEAVEVVDWFSSTVEGQQCLSDMLDRDAYLMENEPDLGKSFTPLQSDLLYKRIDRNIYQNRFRKNLLKVVAVLLPILLLSGLGFYLNRQTDLFSGTTYSEVYVPKGEDARIFFQDGTEVFLNADTKIRYPNRFGLRKREIYLEGEAYFNVASNRSRPFVVHAQHTETEVVGTSFNVRAYGNSNTIEVVLDEGRTAFHVHQNSYPMLPGQKIEYDKSTGRITLRNLINPSNASLWKKNVLHFYDTPLAEVIKELERRFDVQFHVQDAAALNYSYTLTTKQPGIENVLKELQKISPVKFVVEGDTVTVSI
ncbi:FecR/PupR family [Proteiniphilum saccharofermentans]|jgi:transmembrane sensor|uniref:FecR/PupR family n=1 Tax=Proteiniphilum saccharofermentans TaxID=1642647 RepID=A0A1R3T394_9BACT|nr:MULTISPECIES: FecR family protein [Proteiniphilum]SEA30669.1 FecR family protein [Porphyromonadaceae bacterium KH3R12]SFL34655.1 ferric-dicitrate binding protein FerR, regulates iron transport through sigma-19 [Porphyromonadaceae bacterium KH3CP3RA]SFS69533.1 FecR family protein [Porphyromonadaceae bacterium NLAE-zl-C104]MDY9919064.1 FecR domain-containing protein [Proteiniphilum sp.]SCD18957.1 FecR/PupR family [Proteiniphilum saccharofermentans]